MSTTRFRRRPAAADATALAVAVTSLALAALTAPSTVDLLVTADGRRSLADAPADTVTLLVVHLGLLLAGGAATLVLGAVLVTDLVTRRPTGRLARWTPAPLRRAAATLARLGLATGTLLAAAPPPSRPLAVAPAARTAPAAPAAPADDDRPATAVMTALPPNAVAPPALATVRWLGEATPPVTPAAAQVPASPSPTAASPPADDTWIVEPGDSFWSIAEETLADATGEPPQEASVASYWRRLLDANREHLLVPGQPDLLRVGQVLVLPPVR